MRPLKQLMIKIISASVADSTRLSKLCRETFYKKWKSTNTEKDLNNYMEEFFSLKKLETELNDIEISYLLAVENNEPVGYTKLNRNKSEGNLDQLKPIEIQRMYVKEEFIGNGIGNQLMIKAIELAVKDNFEVMWLGAWEKNVQALKFYNRYGFQIYGSHQFVLGEDITTDLLLKKIL